MVSFEDIFSFEIFFIILRESLEIIVIITILLAFLKQSLVLHYSRDSASITSELDETNDDFNVTPEQLTVTGEKLYRQYKLQIIAGSALGLLLSLLIGGVFVATFYIIGTDLWSLSEHYYEGLLSLLAAVVISAMGLFFLRISKLKEKFRVKLANVLLNKKSELRDTESKLKFYSEKYALFVLPFITCLRESLEAFVFIGGVGVGQPLSTLPLSSILGILVSGLIGVVIYNRTNSLSLKIFMIATTCLLYMIAGGLFSKGIWQLELQRYINLCHGQDMSEVGSGPGSYDVNNSVWHVNCCNGETDGFWMLFTAIFGWTNSATWGSVLSYNAYWLIMVLAIKSLKFEEANGYFPYIPIFLQRKRLLKKYDFLNTRQKVSKQAHYIPSHLISSPEGSNAPLLTY